MFQFRQYQPEWEKEWDDFIEKKSINGTFLQSRRFLKYHPVERFVDCSLMIYNDKNNLAALCPACQLWESERLIFYSHKGSTFGGIVIDEKHYHINYVMALIQELKEYLMERGYYRIYLKMTSDIFSIRENDLFSYVFQYYGFYEQKEISTYIHYPSYKEEILSNFSQGKRTNVHNCIKKNLYLKKLSTDDEIKEFYNILCDNLQKYKVEPVHSFAELLDLKNFRLSKECEFFGIYKENEIVAGCLMFYFMKAKCAHVQYMAAKHIYNKLSPMTFLYYSIINVMKKKNFINLSWGIATEDFGRSLNIGLLMSKERFGSSYINNHTYYCTLLS